MSGLTTLDLAAPTRPYSHRRPHGGLSETDRGAFEALAEPEHLARWKANPRDRQAMRRLAGGLVIAGPGSILPYYLMSKASSELAWELRWLRGAGRQLDAFLAVATPEEVHGARSLILRVLHHLGLALVEAGEAVAGKMVLAAEFFVRLDEPTGTRSFIADAIRDPACELHSSDE